MSCSFLFLLASCILAHGGHDHSHDHHDHHEGDGHSHVLDLNEENFKSTIDSSELVLVEFFAPWCGHCQRLAPEYEKAANTLYGSPAVLAKVDCTTAKELCTEYGVQGFPTLKLFRKDAVTDYNAGRTAADIVKFMKRQSQPAVQPIESADALNTFKADNDVAVVGFFDSHDHAGTVIFKAVANTLRNDYAFGIASSSLGKPNSIELFRSADSSSATFDGDLTEEALVSFINAESFPLVGEIGPENYAKYVERGIPLLWIFIDYAAEAHKAVITHAMEVARAFKGELSFVKLDGKRWGSHAKNMGLSGNAEVPGLVIDDQQRRKKYIFPETQEVTRDALQKFVSGWKDGSLSPFLKSQEPPADNDGPVKVVVGKTFDEIVMDKTKDVMVEFYAPWCGHCKSLAPKYDALGEEFQSQPSIVIAKVDSTENDTPADIQGFPTLIFYPANNKNGLIYRGERSTEALAAFIRENANTLSKQEL